MLNFLFKYSKKREFMFNLQNFLYMVISAILTAGLLFLASAKVKEQKYRNLILKLSAVITVLIHISDLWVDYLKSGGYVYVGSVLIFPMYPCNIIMWMLLVTAFIDNKESKVFRFLAEFCLIVGTVCGIIGILFNENFDATPTLADYSVLKGLLSHSTMIFGCVYLFVGGYAKPSVFSSLSLVFGFGIFVVCGVAMNTLYAAFGMESPDGIWIKGVPYVGLSSIILGLLFVLLYFGVLALIELRLPPEERWYSKAKNYFNKITRRK